MIVDPSTFEDFANLIQKQYINTIDILGENFCKNFFDYQTSYLRSIGWVDICISKWGKTKWYYKNYKDFIF